MYYYLKKKRKTYKDDDDEEEEGWRWYEDDHLGDQYTWLKTGYLHTVLLSLVSTLIHRYIYILLLGWRRGTSFYCHFVHSILFCILSSLFIHNIYTADIKQTFVGRMNFVHYKWKGRKKEKGFLSVWYLLYKKSESEEKHCKIMSKHILNNIYIL